MDFKTDMRKTTAISPRFDKKENDVFSLRFLLFFISFIAFIEQKFRFPGLCGDYESLYFCQNFFYLFFPFSLVSLHACKLGAPGRLGL